MYLHFNLLNIINRSFSNKSVRRKNLHYEWRRKIKWNIYFCNLKTNVAKT